MQIRFFSRKVAKLAKKGRGPARTRHGPQALVAKRKAGPLQSGAL